MNEERLLRHYDAIADAPDAITRLRRFIVDLALRGKLVPQDPGDDSPIALVAKAREALRRQAETAKRIRWKDTDPVAVDEIEKDVPPGWVAARVNDTGLYINGLAFKPADWKQSGVPIIRIQNLTDPQKEFNYAEGAFPDEVIVRDGDLLVSWSATLEAFKWERGEGVLNQHIFRVIPHKGLTDPDFLLLLLRNGIREMADSEHAHGLVMAHINRGPFLNHVVLIPPLAEQRRIVAKVGEMMGLCDRIEAARAGREATRDRLSVSSLARLNSPDPETFQSDARFVVDALPALTTRPDHVKALRQTILNLAVRGKLVPQDPNEEPASKLLERIHRERASNMCRREGGSAGGAAEALHSVHLPSSWAAALLGELSLKLHYGYTAPASKTDKDVRLLRITDIQDDRVDWDSVPGCEIDAKTFPKYALEMGDLLIARTGGTIGKTFLVSDIPVKSVFASYLIRVQPARALHAPYIKLFCGSDIYWDQLREGSRGGGQPNVNGTTLGRMIVALPPIAEQHRIVAKVNELMTLCDRLEASLTAIAATRRRLLDTLLVEALAPADTLVA